MVIRLSKGHRRTKILIEKRLGYEVPQGLIEPFFDYADKGIEPVNIDRKRFDEVVSAFRSIAWDYNLWVKDFKEGLLFLSDFDDEDNPTKNLALRAHKSAMGETIGYKNFKKRWL